VNSTTTLTLVDGVRIVVPDSLNLITPYVLQEQQDWFEDEIKFLRRLLQQGQKVIDIGANYGVYTLSMAQTVGPTGRVWAFEPASNTARLLAEGIAANGFAQVVLERSALSSARGAAQLSLNENSELNALVHGAPATTASETVPLVTLDDCMESYGWRDIEFVKIDAEGEEGNILKGGKRFFAALSPLVQYEIKAGTEFHMELVQQFAALGYRSYRLVPGLDLLVPFDAGSTPDGYLVNLFCCKQDRVERLAAHGYLLDSATHLRTTGTEQPGDIPEAIKNGNAYGWRHTIGKLPYGAQLAKRWEQTMAAGRCSAEVDEALSLYARSRDPSLFSGERFGALEASFSLLRILCEREPSYLRLASLARVARDYGARMLAVNALQYLNNTIAQHNQVDLNEPFLAPGERFDSVSPGEAIGNWVLAAVLEELERLGHYSSFYTGASARQRLEMIRSLGFGSAEMERRLRLLRKRLGVSA
jgi:FkbM family methyltransferase